MDLLAHSARWSALWQRVAPPVATPASPQAPHATSIAHSHPVLADLAHRYAEPSRHYHNARHIEDCLAHFDAISSHLAAPDTVELALWFHDSVYDSRAADNEARSADLAGDALSAVGASPALCASVTALILATRDHRAPPGEPDAPWLLDIDLAILGQPPATFDAYETAVRAEYDWVAPAAFAAGRAAILERFLARPQLYLTAPFRSRFESTARDNLHRSLTRLRQTPSP